MATTSSKSSKSPAPSPPGTDAPPSKGLIAGIDPARVVRVLKHQWKLLAGATLICGIVAFAAGKVFGELSYRATGKLTANPILKTEDSPLPPFKFETHIKLLTSPSNIEYVAKKHNLTAPLEKLYKVEEDLISGEYASLSIDWPDKDKAIELVNDLMTIFTERTYQERFKAIKVAMAAADKRLEQSEADLKVVDAGIDAIRKKHKLLFDPKLELDRAQEDLKSLKQQYDQKRFDRNRAETQIGAFKKEIETLNQEGGQYAKKLPQDVKEKLEQLRSALREQENRLQRATTGLAQAQNELTTAEFLLRRKAIPAEEVGRLREKVAQFTGPTGELNTAKKQVDSLRTQINDLEKNPNLLKIRDVENRKRDAEIQYAAVESEIEGLTALLERNREEIQRLTDILRGEAGELLRRRDQLTKEREDLGKRLNTLRQLEANPPREIRQDDAKGTTIAGSTSKKIMAGTFAIPMFLLVAAILGLAMRTDSWKAETLAALLDLPILARSPGEGAQPRRLSTQENRSLALRLRQHLPDRKEGVVMLFTTLVDGEELDDLIGDLSLHLAMRDEKVLILDARIAGSQLARVSRMVERPVMAVAGGSSDGSDIDPCQSGLVQFLVFEGQNPAEFIQPTTTRGVSFLPAGGPCYQTDALASEPMKDLLTQLRRQFSVILMIGPSLDHQTDTEILAAYSGGIVVVLNGPGSSAPVSDFCRSLRESNAQLIGAVICV